MTRADAIAQARQQLHSGEFLAELDRRVAYRTESQNPDRGEALRGYLEEELQPAFAKLDFSTRLIESPTGKSPYLLAEYRESPSAPTVLMYGHGDVVDGMVGEWRDGLDPWRTTTSGNRVYGRGTADNKGQHSINMSALSAVREARGGKLGFNAKFIVEMGEEIGSPDLRQVCEQLRDELAADLFLPPTDPGLPPIAPPFSSAAGLADSSRRHCATVRIIPAIGAACSPIPPPFLPARSPAWLTAKGVCSWIN
jgi:acetylornithine deacetylase/succinyl-diaminopimelate desuccinylase-like protein